MGIDKLTYGLAVGVAYMYREEIKSLLNKIISKIVSSIQSTFDINTESNPGCEMVAKAIIVENSGGEVPIQPTGIPGPYKTWKRRFFEYFLQHNNDGKGTSIVNDGNGGPNYELPPGTYYVMMNEKLISISIDENKMKISGYFIDKAGLRSLFNEQYRTHIRSDKIVSFYTLKNDRWCFLTFRKPRDITKLTKTCSIEIFQQDVKSFIRSEQEFVTDGKPYRKGYLLHGPPRTGKTTMIEYTAIKHDMNIYLVNLNSKDLDDNGLIALIARVPPRSIIVFEELDEQIKVMMANRTNHVSIGGILSALDGPLRLNRGSIIVITTNNLNVVQEQFSERLIQPGRIDKVFKMDFQI